MGPTLGMRWGHEAQVVVITDQLELSSHGQLDMRAQGGHGEHT